MDPVGPWSAYASYNRLAGVQGAAAPPDLHHHLTTSGVTPSTTTAQLLPGGFLSPPPVGYETVFSPLFHHAGTKPSHYVTAAATQQRAPTSKQPPTENDYHQPSFFEQGGGVWQQNSPFGILPHESVVAAAASTTPGAKSAAAATYENFNFAAAQTLNHLAASKSIASTTRAQSPQVAGAAKNVSFFQVPTSFGHNSTSNTPSLQQSCIVTSPSNITPISKEYRVPQPPSRAFLNTPRASPSKQTTTIQTKAQAKIYPELTGNQPQQPSDRQRNNEDQSQSSPISFSLNYTGNNVTNTKRGAANTTQFQQPYRYTQQNSGSPDDFQRKNGTEYTSNSPDCNNVVVPRRPSPLQAHSQPSPLGHAASPAYPMYNSPMNAISSPQNQQITPPSPLDVTVPRPNPQTPNVAYPSVITRALNSDNKPFNERFERSQQNCWDERRATTKFPGQNNTAAYGSNTLEMNNRVEQQRALGITERQQAYFDTGAHQLALQDLSSCRGDPMSIVKNLQQQQQSCQQVNPTITPPNDVKVEVKSPPNKRRKSGDKNEGRIPPPAHSTTATPQQQNGGAGYFEFDRWNLAAAAAASAPGATKIFSGQQHQSLIQVAHPHSHHHHHAPPPPLPYFAPFHLAPPPHATTHDFEMTAMQSGYDTSNTQYATQTPQPQQSQPQSSQDTPKVVVPNIEEELNFLAQTTVSQQQPNKSAAVTPMIKPVEKPIGSDGGFMGSFLKFLQGERDSSPPPTARGGRKQSWTKPKMNVDEKSNESNGSMGQVVTPMATTTPLTTTIPKPIVPVKRLSQGDPQDDPRYFPLPKERKRNSFDSSDDGLSSEDDFFGAVKKFSPPREGKERQSRKVKSTRSGEKKKHRTKHDRDRDLGDDSLENIPRRETSKRAAKEKSNFQNLMKGDDEPEEPMEYQDSDSDPAWTPQLKDDEEPIIVNKHKKRTKPLSKSLSKNRTRNLITAAAQGAGIQETDGYASDHTAITTAKKSIKNNRIKQTGGPPTLEDNIAASLSNSFTNLNDNLFKPGEFVAIKSELTQKWPSLWKVDGKSLLQKYEPFEENGTTFYRNISTYTSWTPESRKQYIAVPIRYKNQTQYETIVEFLRHEMNVLDIEFQEKCMKNSEIFQDNFEVYIQTLISQALDSNFLTEIFQEKDDYFLSNVKIIDDTTECKKKKLLNLLKWPPSVQAAVCTWPCYNVIREVHASDVKTKTCAACGKLEISVRVLMYGQPYNSTTLEGCQPDPKAMNEKNFLMCRVCAARVELSNKVTHQKYLMYIECAKRVAEKRTNDPSKDTTCILNELLADENWLNQLFYQVRTSWAEIDCIEHNFQTKNLVHV